MYFVTCKGLHCWLQRYCCTVALEYSYSAFQRHCCMRVLVYCGTGTALKLQSTLSFLLRSTVVEGHCC
jgi:hypothetical protein